MLKNLSVRSNLPWCCIGDYNDLFAQVEKRDRLNHPNSLILGFREVVDYYGLKDVGMREYPFTWEKSRGSVNWVEERLDRAMATNLWFSLFENACVFNLETPTSNHSTLLLEFIVEVKKHTRRFRFENAQIQVGGRRNIMVDSWNRNPNNDVQRKILTCSRDLMTWGDKIRLQFRNRISPCRQKIKVLKLKKDEISVKGYMEATEELANLLQQ